MMISIVSLHPASALSLDSDVRRLLIFESIDFAHLYLDHYRILLCHKLPHHHQISNSPFSLKVLLRNQLGTILGTTWNFWESDLCTNFLECSYRNMWMCSILYLVCFHFVQWHHTTKRSVYCSNLSSSFLCPPTFFTVLLIAVIFLQIWRRILITRLTYSSFVICALTKFLWILSQPESCVLATLFDEFVV